MYFTYNVLLIKADGVFKTNFFDGQGFAEHHLSQLWSVSENAHKSWTTSYILLLIHFLKLAGKITKKRKNRKKYWSRLDSNHCAPGCWITR